MKLTAPLKHLTVAAVILVSTTITALAEKRLALVIGNGSYQHSAVLANPVNDARAISDKLAGLGFEIHEGYDLDKTGMDVVLRNFARAATTSDLNVFFYAGHGMSVDGTNYLVPIDARFEDQTSLDFEAVSVDFVTRQMSISEAVNLVFLDACRDNPLSRTLSRSLGATRSSAVGGGLSEMKIASPGKGMAISFATSPGDVALDGDGNNSPFTQALLRHLDAENTDIAEVFSRVTGDVYEATDKAQRPWQNVSLTGPVVLNPVTRVATVQDAERSTGTAPSANSSTMLEEQKILFGLARDTGAIEDYQAYLDSFPNGLFANNARRTIRSLQGTQTAALGTSSTQRTTGSSVGGPNPADAISESGPLVLPVTNNLRNAVSNQGTEQALDLNRKEKGDIQAMLNATGNNVGGVDGRWGKNTRSGLSNWQAVNGLVATSYLNASQLELLRSQTNGRYTPYTPPVATAKRKPSNGSRPRRAKSGGKKVDAGAVLLGVAAGILLSK